MTTAARERWRVRAPLLSISGAAWALLALEPSSMAMPMICLGSMPSMLSVEQLFALTAPASLAAGWALMLAAMMAPVLIAPVRHICHRSFARRRLPAIALFLAAYGALWMAAGSVLLGFAIVVRLVVPESSALLAAAIGVALAWQMSPAKQQCLNRSHHHPPLAAFGRAADMGVLRFGLTHGFWCICSCWALMLLPLLMPGGHVVGMAVVALALFTERLDSPAPPRWRLHGVEKAARIAIAQTRIHLRLIRLADRFGFLRQRGEERRTTFR